MKRETPKEPTAKKTPLVLTLPFTTIEEAKMVRHAVATYVTEFDSISGQANIELARAYLKRIDLFLSCPPIGQEAK